MQNLDFDTLKDNVIEFLLEHKHSLIKLTPILLAIYLAHPLLELGWQWLPWLVSVHYVYTHLDNETTKLFTDFCKWYFSKNTNTGLKDSE